MGGEYEIFARVVEAGSLSAAARELGASPAMISKRIARLESRLGVRLVERSTRSLALTEPGRQFYERVRRILDEVADAEAAVSGRSVMQRSLLRISAPTSFGRLHLAPHLGRFIAEHPGVGIELNLTDSYVDLLAEGVDVAVRIAALQDTHSSATWLAPNRRALCAAPAYLDAFGEPQTLGQLRGHRLLAAANQSPWRLIGPEGPVSVRVRSFVRTNSSEVVRELVLGGVGVALRSTWDVAEELRSGRLKVVLPEFKGSADVAVYAMRSPRRANAAAIDAFVGFLQGIYGPTPYWDEPA